MVYYKIKVGNRFYNQKEKCIFPNISKGTRSHTLEEVKELYTEAKKQFSDYDITVLKVEETEIDIATL